MKEKISAFKKFYAQEKPITWIILGLFVIASIVCIIFSEQITGAESIFYEGSPHYAFKGAHPFIQWLMQRIPSLVNGMIAISFAVLIYKFVRFLAKHVFHNNNRMLTVISLFLSLLKWVIIIMAVFLVLAAFGVNTTVLLASAGILTLVIGLGAQSLVADVLAGFFLVFEGEYQVGDIITVDGWRGTVLEIGIRVTKLKDAGGNIKTINNSDVKNVINQTNELSVAVINVPIDYEESLERVEKILKDSFPQFPEKIPAIVGEPTYKGVSDFNDSSVSLLIIAKCKEEDIYQTQRDLKREIFLLFKQNNINIPFPQMVVSQRKDRVTKVSKEIKEEAEAFVKEQNANSKDIVQ